MKKNYDFWVCLHPIQKKLIMELKISILIILVTFGNIFASNTYSQAAKVTLNVENKTLEQVMDAIEQQSEFYFLFNQKQIDIDRKVNIHVEGKVINEILPDLFRGTNVKYAILDHKILLTTDDSDNYTERILHQAQYVVSGTVTDASNGDPMPGVNIVIRGTTTGTITDMEGKYVLGLNDPNSVIQISFVGYTPQEIAVAGRRSIDIMMVPSMAALDEVVVTALGIKKERKSLGYSVSEIKGNDLTANRNVNLMNTLVGKVAGLNASSIAGGPGASSNVIIRGLSSLGGTNQPLYVVDGVPMESEPNGVAGGQFSSGPDRGDAIGNISPDDIESISVLKGAAAAALYGYRAKAGVVLITTKSASGDGIEYNSNFNFDQIIDLTDFQYVYGQGVNNKKPTSAAQGFETGQRSWGAKLDGSQAYQFDGVERPYVAQRDNLKKFYRLGNTWTNNLAFNKTFQDGAVRFSASDLRNNSVMPNSGLNRQNLILSGSYKLFKRLTIDAKANYILENAKNRASLGDTPGNANYGVVIIANSVDIDNLKDAVNSQGGEIGTSSNVFATNPWFAAYKMVRNTGRDRLISSLNLRYDFDNGLYAQGRIGRDYYSDSYKSITPNGTAYNPLGTITELNGKFSDLNVDGLIGKAFKVGQQLNIVPNIGASYRKTGSQNISNSGSNFAVPFIYTIANAKNKSVNQTISNSEVQSLYGTVDVEYQNYLFLHGSLRSDWFSTLATPGLNNKLNVVYPSVSASFVFTELASVDWIDFGKMRVGYAVVGQATVPYQTQLSYALGSTALYNMPVGSISNTSVPNRSLRPSKANEIEIGTEMRLFGSRVSLDLSVYTKKSEDEIIFAPTSFTSGYTSAALNIGKMRNNGLEALVNIKVIDSKGFKWNTGINTSFNRNKIISLSAGQSQLLTATSRSGVGFIANVVGLPAAQVMAYDYKYDSDGNILRDRNNVPMRGDLKPWGSAYPTWIGGWSNDFSYKRFNLSFLIDGKFGGKIFASMNYNANRYGLLKSTLENREANFGTSENPIDAMSYYTTFGANVSKQFVLDASFIKFRQISMGYSFPSAILNGKVKSVHLSVVAKDLFWFMRKTDNIDPEGSYSSEGSGLTYGIENGGLPPVRSYGLNLNVMF